MTKDELKAMLAEIEAEKNTAAEETAKAKKVTDLETSVKTLSETVEKQKKEIEELAKSRGTDPGAGQSGEVTKEMIFNAPTPEKAAELTEIYKSQKKGK